MGWTVVSGGTVKGTMGVIADASAACGGRHVGILPRFMEPLVHPALSETVWTDTMAERKEKMREGADLVLALPGGIGTLDELIETLVLLKLGRWKGRIAALNVDGFYDPFQALLDHYVATEMLEPGDRARIAFPRTVEELTALL
jgi:uncharacterized protein (TIGR00730 family)